MNAANFAARLALGGVALLAASAAAPCATAQVAVNDGAVKQAAVADEGGCAEPGCAAGCSDCFNFPGPKNYSAQVPPHAMLYPTRTKWMWRYTYKHGVHYDRPYDYRTLSDFPWHSRKGFGPGPTPQFEAPGYEEYQEWHPADATPLARGAARPSDQPREAPEGEGNEARNTRVSDPRTADSRRTETRKLNSRTANAQAAPIPQRTSTSASRSGLRVVTGAAQQ